MLQDRQVDRMVLKVARLEAMYSEFMVKDVIYPRVFIERRGKRAEVSRGYKWGSDFELARFSFVAEGLDEGEKYFLFANTGAPEHLIIHEGRKIGILDYITGAFEPPSRTHRYVLLEGLKNGDEVVLEAFFSQEISGIAPYDEPLIWAYATLDRDRPYEEIGLAVFDLPLKNFVERLSLFNKAYKSTADRFERARMEKVYLELFKALPMEKARPDAEAVALGTRIIDAYFEGERELPYVGIIGHSHLDTAWLWTVEETRRKLMRTVSNAVTLLHRHPEYRFFMSTVLYLKWIEEDDPALFSEVKKLVLEGRFEVNGATWVECDGNLTGSEAFCRQFIRGKRYLREKFGYESDTFWLPDTFGYSAALPQIMKKSNVDYFLTTKLSWNDTNVFPYESFRWKGIDGSEIPVHFNTTHTGVDPQTVRARLDKVHDPRECDSVLIAYGFGDGGGGPAEEMVSRAIHTERTYKDATVEHTTVSDFMKRVTRNELPTYFGELYLELHRGTYTTNHRLKEYNRRLEEALHDAELISVLEGDTEAKAHTDAIYDTLMLNQFHDILPGTCLAEATDIALAENLEALKQARSYSRGKGRRVYFNTLPFDRVEILPSRTGQTYSSVSGERTVAPYRLDALGYARRLTEDNSPFTVEGDVITTPYLKATICCGVIKSLVFEGRELVEGGFNVIKAYEDVPYIYDNWDVDADYTLKEKSVRFVGQKIISVGQYLLVVRVKHEIADGSLIETDIKFRYDDPTVEFENRLVAGDKHTLIRAEFDTTLFAPTYKCETQFGHVDRNCFDRDKSDIAKFEVCSHKWTDLSEKGMGVSLLSDCKYGVSCHGGKMGITLHKSGTHPDPRGDLGEFFFRYAIYPHRSALGMDTVRHAYAFNYAPVATARRNMTPPFKLVGGDSVVLETVKHGEDGGVVLRFYEAMGASDAVVLEAPGREIVECNILEDEVGTKAHSSLTIELSPFEIKTVKIK